MNHHLEGKYDWFSGVRVDVVEGRFTHYTF